MPDDLTCGDWAERFLARYERERKASSYGTARRALRGFLADFGDRPLRSVTRAHAMDWADRQPPSLVPIVRTLFSAAVDAELIDRNPFRGTVRRSRGRSDQHPPTEAELSALLDACAVHGWYAPRMRALLISPPTPACVRASYTRSNGRTWTSRPCVCTSAAASRAAGWTCPSRAGCARWRSRPWARDALAGLPREHALVFTTKTGKRFGQSTHSRYWAKVLARSGLAFDFYLATKHYAVHYLHATLGLKPRVIAEQVGWTLASVIDLLAVYGHGDVGALDEIDRAFADNVRALRAVPDAGQTQNGA